MGPTSLLIFAGALLVNAGSPGPSIAALVAQVIAKGYRGVFAFLAAMWIGEAIWLALASFGLAVLAESFFWVFAAIKYLGVLYLLYLAWKMWTASPRFDAELPEDAAESNLRLFLTGFAVTMGNPKIMVFYLALLPTIIALEQVTLVGWAELTLTMFAVLAVIDLGYVLLAVRARKLLSSPRAVRIANRCSAAIMGGAAAAIALK